MKINYSKIIPFLIFLFLIAVTFGGWRMLHNSLVAQGQENLDALAEEISGFISDRINIYTDSLYGSRGLFAASKTVERNEWQSYIKAIKISDRYPGISSISYVEKVLKKDKDFFVKLVKSDTSINQKGYPDYKITPESDKEEYYLGKYVEPEEGRESVLGFDFSSEVARNRALMLSRDENIPVVTEVVNLVTTGKPGMSIVLPIFKSGAPINSVVERRENLIGFVLAGMRVDDFFGSLDNGLNNNTEFIFEMYDTETVTQNSIPFYVYNRNNATYQKNVFQDKTFQIPGRNWVVRVYNASSSFLNIQSQFLSYLILGGGILLSTLIGLLAYFLMRGRVIALRVAEEMTIDLKESEERFRAITEAAKDAIVMSDSEGKIVLWNKAAVEIFGYNSKDAIGKKFVDLAKIEEMNGDKAGNLERYNKNGEVPFLGKSMDVLVRDRVGKKFEVEVVVTRTKLQGKDYLVAIMRDITLRKKQEEELKKRTIELERLNKNMVGRELKMMELKQEIEKLKKK